MPYVELDLLDISTMAEVYQLAVLKSYRNPPIGKPDRLEKPSVFKGELLHSFGGYIFGAGVL